MTDLAAPSPLSTLHEHGHELGHDQEKPEYETFPCMIPCVRPLQLEHAWSQIHLPGFFIGPTHSRPPPSTDTGIFSPPPPSPLSPALPLFPSPSFAFFGTTARADDGRSAPAVPLRAQAETGLADLFRLILERDAAGDMASLGRGAFWERIVDEEDGWRPPSGRRTKAFEVVFLVLEIEHARSMYLTRKARTEGGGAGDGRGTTELETLVDEFSRVWERWETL